VALARALVLKPKVLLLDEPLSALDKKMREQMQSELRRLQRQVGITFILVTHDQEEALIMSDRIAVMFEGQIAQMASPQELYRRPATRRVGEFIGVMNFLSAKQTGSEKRTVTFEVEGLGTAVVDEDQLFVAFDVYHCIQRMAALTSEVSGCTYRAHITRNRAFRGRQTDEEPTQWPQSP